MTVCINPDEFLEEKTIWIVELSDGTIVYQDDERPGINPPSAWIRLGNHVRERKLKIEKMRLRFRSHEINLPEKAAGYYFARSCGADWGSDKTLHFVVCGVLLGETIRCQQFKIPELIPTDYIEKDRKDAVQPYFISNI